MLQNYGNPFHQRLAEGLAGVQQALHDVDQREHELQTSVTTFQGTMQHALRNLENRVQTLEQQAQQRHTELVNAYDALKGASEGRRSWLKR